MKIHKGLKNGPINENYPFLEREDNVECKYIIRNEFLNFSKYQKRALN